MFTGQATHTFTFRAHHQRQASGHFALIECMIRLACRTDDPDILFLQHTHGARKVSHPNQWNAFCRAAGYFFAVVNFAFFLLGRKLGLIVYIFIAMLFGGIYGAVSSLKGMEFLMAGDKTMIFIIGIPIGILFVVISFFLSLACYKKRYS